MSTQHRANTNPVRIHADHAAQKRLGDWTTARAFEVCARHAEVVIDLRSPPPGCTGSPTSACARPT